MLRLTEPPKDTLQFIDRDDIRNTIEVAYNTLYQDITFFQIISIYGVGGIGKTQLLREEFLNNSILPIRPVYITLEITHKDDLLDILIKFRKALPENHKYPLFDYAMLYIWNYLNASQLDVGFLKSTQRNVIEFFKPFVDIAAGAPTQLPVGSIIEAVCNATDALKNLYNSRKINSIIDRIKNMGLHDILQVLPVLLGTDIHKAFLDDHFALVLDSYKVYSDRHDSFNWLTSLLESIGYGVFVIASREKINWPPSLSKTVIYKNLESLPEEEVRTALQAQLSSCPQLIENIIRMTDCMPIYLDLTVSTVLESRPEQISKNMMFFSSKEDIIEKFLAHLSVNEQETFIVLAIVQIFDVSIFEYLVKDLHLQVNVLEFEAICKRSLIRNYEYDSYFYKTHDVISNNIQHITDEAKIRRILQSYLKYMTARGRWHYSSIQVNMLLKHIIGIYIVNGLNLFEFETEQLLDIYFSVKEALVPFDCDEIDGFNIADKMKYFYCFVKALCQERANSNERLTWLESIDEMTCNFGKHLKSLRLMKGYLQALCIGTQYLKAIVDELDPKLTIEECTEWYYGQTKIFYGDCCVSYGEYKRGLKELENYRKLLSKLPGKENDMFQVTRHIAHAYRFNMMLDKAAAEYSNLIYGEDASPTPLQKIYILTNLCETYCYFEPNKVLQIIREALALSNNFKDLKSKGKIYYSLAIVWLHKKKYKRAKKCIRKSLYLNQVDGYIAGKLYAYMALAYLEYACYHQLSKRTLSIIENIQQKIQVYTCFRLPIALMKDDYSEMPSIMNSQEWIDFYQTAVAYRQFLDCLA